MLETKFKKPKQILPLERKIRIQCFLSLAFFEELLIYESHSVVHPEERSQLQSPAINKTCKKHLTMCTTTSASGTYRYHWQVVSKRLKSVKIMFSVISLVYLTDLSSWHEERQSSIGNLSTPFHDHWKYSRITGLTRRAISTQTKQICWSCFNDIAIMKRSCGLMQLSFKDSLYEHVDVVAVASLRGHQHISYAIMCTVARSVKFKTKARSPNCAKTFQYQNGLNHRCWEVWKQSSNVKLQPSVS